MSAFHRSLARTPPAGLRASACFRAHEPPWGTRGREIAAGPGGPEGANAGPIGAAAEGGAPAGEAASGPLYEDWYLVEDYTALGVLNEAATGRGHRSSHEEIAMRSGTGAGGLYMLLAGEPGARSLAQASLAVWITPPLHRASRRVGPGDLLGDGMDAARASLWRRQLVLGPAPEFCALGPEVPPGAGPARLPPGWGARTVSRELVHSG